MVDPSRGSGHILAVVCVVVLLHLDMDGKIAVSKRWAIGESKDQVRYQDQSSSP